MQNNSAPKITRKRITRRKPVLPTATFITRQQAAEMWVCSVQKIDQLLAEGLLTRYTLPSSRRSTKTEGRRRPPLVRIQLSEFLALIKKEQPR